MSCLHFHLKSICISTCIFTYLRCSKTMCQWHHSVVPSKNNGFTTSETDPDSKLRIRIRVFNFECGSDPSENLYIYISYITFRLQQFGNWNFFFLLMVGIGSGEYADSNTNDKCKSNTIEIFFTICSLSLIMIALMK